NRLGSSSFRGALIVGAAGGVDVRIAGVPSPLRRIDPALQSKLDLIRLGANRYPVQLVQIFGAAPRLDDIVAVGQADRLTIGTIDLRLELQIRSEAHGLQRTNPLEAVPDHQGGQATAAVVLADSQGHVAG